MRKRFVAPKLTSEADLALLTQGFRQVLSIGGDLFDGAVD